VTVNEVVVRRDEGDFLALERHRREVTPRRRWTGVVLAVVKWAFVGLLVFDANMLIIMWGLDTYEARKPPLDLLEVGAFGGGMLAVAGGLVLTTGRAARRRAGERHARSEVRRQIKTGRVRTGEDVRIRLDADGWTETDGGRPGESRVLPWSAVRRIDATDDHLFVGSGAGEWRVVPARAFADPAAFREFASRVRSYVLAANDE
jgi:YcxB-like protein